jgi:hypothetical protein
MKNEFFEMQNKLLKKLPCFLAKKTSTSKSKEILRNFNGLNYMLSNYLFRKDKNKQLLTMLKGVECYKTIAT